MKIFSNIYFFLLPFLLLAQNCEYKGGNPDFLPKLSCVKDFTVLQGNPLAQKFGAVSSIKVVYEIKSHKLYFINSNKYRLHFDFVSKVLHGYQDLGNFNFFEYSDKAPRKYVLCNINHYENSDYYTLEFFADDKVKPNLVEETFKAIQANTFFGNKLKLLLNSAEMTQKSAKIAPDISRLSIDSIYRNQTYQPLNRKKAYGYLRKVAVKDFSKVNFRPDDIILTDGLPNDFPLVSGIITTQFQTPLCHINILSTNRGTPNAAWKTAWNDANVAALIDEWIYYEVNEDSIILRKADVSTKLAYENQKKNRKTIVLEKDVKVNHMVEMRNLSYQKTSLVGGKAANFAEMMKITTDGGQKLNMPEGAFAIPVYFYVQHIEKNGLMPLIEAILMDKTLQNDRKQLDSALKVLRKKIKDAPIDENFLQEVKKRIRKNGLSYKAYRFRSSTNAEDIPGFNGAGLYDSKTGILGDKEKTIDKAIKQVWASLWNVRAFEEREYFAIDQRSVAMGVLVHRAFGDEELNGVAITKNIYRKDYPSFTINAQKGEVSVVLPPSDTIICEQFLINFSGYVSGIDEIAIEYISNSSLNEGKPLLTEKEIVTLAQYLKAIKKHYYYRTSYGLKASDYYEFGMDVEFKLEAKTRKLYVKQARLF